MSSDSAENNPPKEKSFELDLSSLGFGPSWVSGPSEKVSSGNGGPRRDGDRPVRLRVHAARAGLGR